MYGIYGPPFHKKQEIHTTERCVDTTFEILTFYVLKLHLYFNFNLNYFSNAILQLTYIMAVYICVPFTDIR
jgi:hypothetical protein